MRRGQGGRERERDDGEGGEGRCRSDAQGTSGMKHEGEGGIAGGDRRGRHAQGVDPVAEVGWSAEMGPACGHAVAAATLSHKYRMAPDQAVTGGPPATNRRSPRGGQPAGANEGGTQSGEPTWLRKMLAKGAAFVQKKLLPVSYIKKDESAPPTLVEPPMAD